jgi:hypothetical protein
MPDLYAARAFARARPRRQNVPLFAVSNRYEAKPMPEINHVSFQWVASGCIREL